MAQGAELLQLARFSDRDKKKSVILTGFTFMKPVDLCSLHLPTGDCYTAENHCCNITCIVLGLRLWWAPAATVHCLWLSRCISSAAWVQRGMSPLLKTVLWIHNFPVIWKGYDCNSHHNYFFFQAASHDLVLTHSRNNVQNTHTVICHPLSPKTGSCRVQEFHCITPALTQLTQHNHQNRCWQCMNLHTKDVKNYVAL